MIIVSINGGLGNQLFQYSFGRYLALKHNTELKLDLSYYERYSSKVPHDRYRLGEFNIQENFATQEEISKMQFIRPKIGFYEFLPELLNLPDNVYLYGGWENENYFKDIRDVLLKEFTLKNPLHKNSAQWKEKILSAENPVSLHVRLGDYTTTIWRIWHGSFLSMDFYYSCVEEIKKYLSNFKIFVFSNDLTMSKYKLKLDVPVEFVEGCESDVEEMYLMSLCKYNIFPKSTFSWWGAWLNKNPDKKIFTIEKYYKLNNCKVVSVKRNINPNFEFPPLFSIILYVENDMDSISLTMSSIFSQKFKDYEVIVIDSSADSSGQICRKFAQNANVTVIRTDYLTDKFIAWNMGADIARGDYFLFLTGKEFVFSHTLDVISFYIHNDFVIHLKAKDVKYGTWDDSAKDIIGAVQTVKLENNSNKKDIEDDLEKFSFENVFNKGIDGRKYSVSVDEGFKDIEKYKDIKLDNLQKLDLLSNNKLNLLMNTKVFKRKFLKKHNIRFSSDGGELKFITDAMLSTNEIVCIKRTFGGNLQ